PLDHLLCHFRYGTHHPLHSFPTRRSSDLFRFYDINSDVIELARSEFTFLRDSRAKVEVALGDARLSLEREPAQNFDVLALDAFSDRKSTRLNSSHVANSYAVFCLIKKIQP